MDKEIGKNIWYASIGYLLPSLFAYLFLFIATKIVSVNIIGLVATIGSFVTLVGALNNANAPAGMRRTLGIAFSTGDMVRFKQFLISTLVFVLIGVLLSIILISIPQLRILESIGIEYQYTWIIILMIFATGLYLVLYEVLVSSLSSKNLIVPLVVGSLVRFPIFFGFVYLLNAPAIGTILAYACMLFIPTIFYAAYTVDKLTGIHVKWRQTFSSDIRYLIKASVVSWVPAIIAQLGTQLGVVIVFASKGSLEAGLYYVPMTIFAIALFISTGIQRISQPLVAGMATKEQQVKYLSHTLKLAFMFTMPIAMPLLFFARDFLGILGQNFIAAASIQNILMIAVPFDIVSGIVYHFIYGRGDHRSILLNGLVSNIPRTALYFVLVPPFGGNGAALTFLIGSLTNFVFTIWQAKIHSLNIEYKKYSILSVIPISISIVLWYIHVYFIISSLIIFFGSLLVYVKLRLLTDDDIHNALFASIPKTTANRIYLVLIKITKKIR